jgi:hypothetical protein
MWFGYCPYAAYPDYLFVGRSDVQLRPAPATRRDWSRRAPMPSELPMVVGWIMNIACFEHHRSPAARNTAKAIELTLPVL